MSSNKTVLVVILVIVFMVILSVSVLVVRQERPEASEAFEPSVESMDDITIPVWGIVIPTPEYIKATSIIPVSDGRILFRRLLLPRRDYRLLPNEDGRDGKHSLAASLRRSSKFLERATR